jgi:hypothetical protein
MWLLTLPQILRFALKSAHRTKHPFISRTNQEIHHQQQIACLKSHFNNAANNIV